MLRIKVDEQIVGNVTDLPGAEGSEWSTNEEGQTTRTVEDKSGTLLELQIGPDGSLLNLQIPPPTVTEETVEESSSSQSGDPQQGGGAQEAAGQVTNQAGQAVQGVQDTVGSGHRRRGYGSGPRTRRGAHRRRRSAAGRRPTAAGWPAAGSVRWRTRAERCRDADLSRLTQLRPPAGAAVRKE